MPATIKFALVLRCKRHPRYDPTIHGEAGIRGGCVACTGMYDLYLQVRRRLEDLCSEIGQASRDAGFEAQINGAAPSHAERIIAPLPSRRPQAKAAGAS